MPDSGWVSFYLHGEEDVPFALALFRRNYERIHAIVQIQQANPSLSIKQPSHTEHEGNH